MHPNGMLRLMTVNNQIYSQFKVGIQHELSHNDNQLPDHYDIAFTMDSVDSRGEYSNQLVVSSSTTSLKTIYSNDDLILTIDTNKIKLRDFFSDYDGLNAYNSFLFDTTNLSFSEILIILRKLFSLNKKCNVGFVYTQPLKYEQKYSRPNETHSFSLSNTINQVDIIPGFNTISASIENSLLIAFIGFEASRLARTLNPDEGDTYELFSPVFCVPPFLTGWENHSLMAHGQLFEDYEPDEVYFSSAFGFISSYQKITDIKKLLGNRKLIVAPYGTKPSSVGVAIAAAQHSDINIVYDFPERSQGRSSGVGVTSYLQLSLN